MTDHTEEQKQTYIASLRAEIAATEARGDSAADAEAELERVLGTTQRTGQKATRLKGEGRTA